MSARSNAAAVNIDDLDDEYIWSPSFPPLSDFEKNLRCEICGEFFNAPVSLIGCKHAFCSTCLRSHLTGLMGTSQYIVKPSCPCCKDEVDVSGNDFAKAFYPNHQLEKVTTSFKEMRSKLKSVIDLAAAGGTSNAATEAVNAEPIAQDHENDMGRLRAARAARRAPVADQDDDDEFQVVAEAKTTITTRTKMARRVYTSMKKKKLQEICRAEGLDTSGSEKELTERHKAFVMAWNAECDSLQPRSRKFLLDKVRAHERAQRQTEAAAARHDCHVQSSGFREGFGRLIQEGQQRLAKEKGEQPAVAAEHADSATSGATTADIVNPTLDKAMLSAGEDMPSRVEIRIDKPGTEQQNGSLDEEESVVSVATSGGHVSVDQDTKENRVENATNLESIGSGHLAAALCDSDLQPHLDRLEQRKPTSISNKRRRTSDSGGRLSESGGIIGPWSCVACTFLNTKRTWSRASCEVCETPRLSDIRSEA